MPEGVQDDPIHDDTKRPKAEPIPEGKGPFKEFICVDFALQIILPLDMNLTTLQIYSLYSLQTKYCLKSLIERTRRPLATL